MLLQDLHGLGARGDRLLEVLLLGHEGGLLLGALLLRVRELRLHGLDLVAEVFDAARELLALGPEAGEVRGERLEARAERLEALLRPRDFRPAPGLQLPGGLVVRCLLSFDFCH